MNLQLHPLMIGYKYYYTTLSQKQKQVYIDLYKALCTYKKTAITSKIDNLTEIIEMIVADNPLIFFFREYKYTRFSNKTIVTFEYLVSPEETMKLIEKLYQRIKDITEQTKGESDFEKELYFHDFFANNVSYNNKFPKYSFMAIGALLYGSAVCSGISSAFKLLCDCAKIPCVVVHGESNNEAHAWNKVYIQNGFYNVDATYDTTLSDSDNIRYDYFNVPDAWLIAERKETTPSMQCNFTEYNYHIKNKIYFDNKKQLESYIFKKITMAKYLNIRIDISLFEKNMEDEIEKLIKKAHQKAYRFFSYSYSFNKDQGIYIYERKES